QLQPRGRSEHDPGRAERLPLPALPPRHRQGNNRAARERCHAVPGGPGGLRGGHTPDGEPRTGLSGLGLAGGMRRGGARGGGGGGIRGASGPSGGRGAPARGGVDLDHRPRRRQRHRRHRHRRARPRQWPPGAPLVPPRADGLARAPPLWQHDGAEAPSPMTPAEPKESLVTWTHVIYGLHAFSLLTGILGAATVVGAFLTGWPSIIAVIMNYLKRSEARGTWLESHFRWQIRTFWFGLLW